MATTAPRTAPIGRPGFNANQALYVGELAPSVTEQTLYSLFNQVGNLASVNVVRDHTTGVSKGYAYVNYHSPQEAAHAIERLSNTNLEGRPIRVMPAQRDPTLRQSQVNNLHVKKIPLTITAADFYDVFTRFGNIVSSKLSTDPTTGKSLGYGFVQFQAREAADAALKAAAEGTLLIKDSKVEVADFVPKDKRVSSNTTVYIKNFADGTTADALTKLVSPVAEVTDILIGDTPKDSPTGFAYITFATAEGAAKAIAQLNGTEGANGTKLYLAPHLKKAVRQQQKERQIIERRRQLQLTTAGRNLYLRFLPSNFTTEKLHALVSEYAAVESARAQYVNFNPRVPGGNYQCSGVGYVLLKSADDAERVISALDKFMLEGTPSQRGIMVTLFKPKDQRLKELAEKNMRRHQQQQFMAMPPGYGMGGMGVNLYPTHAGPRGYKQHQQRGGRKMEGAGPRQQHYPMRQEVVPGPAPNSAEFRQQVGEVLYVRILDYVNKDDDKAGRITGMMLESLTPEELTKTYNGVREPRNENNKEAYAAFRSLIEEADAVLAQTTA